ncbi:hypothetical protein [Sulfuriferula nivalis]|uniref:Uncharacterized protein n=1 Tax=Sulfuriferula nivalis TaxID=2675298 RepID=A0A809S7M0_9PROT|nr:hypothetical protein [Sulfuriferula nivalis]BBO99631.1 hypothetical protein SFSGTM_03400 [Sulfuriferula nivalis]
MIPSSPKRTWIFLLLSSLAFYVPSLLAPASWDKNATYVMFSSLYQGGLVLAGFWYGPAICRALIITEVVDGPLWVAMDATLAALHNNPERTQLANIPVVLVEYAAPFIVTAGLLPQHSQIFTSSYMVERLGADGLRFALARALVHSNWLHRLTAILPVLILTVMLPDTPSDMRDWLSLGGFLLGWLVLHWSFELWVDHQAAQAMGAAEAVRGLRELLAGTTKSAGWLMLHPPVRWRLYMVAGK